MRLSIPGGSGYVEIDIPEVTPTSPGVMGAADKALINANLALSFVNAKAFGVVGDGVTDDAPAFQQMLNVASGVTNGTIFYIPVPAVAYRLNSTLTYTGNPSSAIIFQGAISTRANHGVVFKWGGSVGGTMLMTFGMNFSKFENVRFDCNNTACYGLWFRSNQPNGGSGSDQITLERVGVANAVDNGATLSALVVAGEATNTFQVSTITCRDCDFTGAGGADGQTTYCVLIQQSGVGNVETVHFEHCNIGSAKYLFYFANSNNCISFRGCNFGHVTVAAILYGLGFLTVEDCQIENLNLPAPYQGQGLFLIAGSQSHSTIRNCELVMDISQVSDQAMFSTAGTLIIEGGLVDGTADGNASGGTYANSTIAAVRVNNAIINNQNGASSAIRLDKCSWRNVNPSNNFPVIVDSNGNVLLGSPSGSTSMYGAATVSQLSPVAIEVVDVIGVMLDGTRGICARVVGAPLQCLNLGPKTNGITSGVQILYRGELRKGVYSVYIDYTALIAASTLETLVFGTMRNHEINTRVVMEVTTPFAGPGFTGLTLAVGTNSGSNRADTNPYVLASDMTVSAVYGLRSAELGTGLGSPVQGGDQFAAEYFLSTTQTLLARFVSSGSNLGNGTVTNLTAGRVRIYISTEYLGHP